MERNQKVTADQVLDAAAVLAEVLEENHWFGLQEGAMERNQMTADQVLDAAADLLEENHWCQGVLAMREDSATGELVGSWPGVEGLTHFCAMGALMQASIPGPGLGYSSAMKKAIVALRLRIPGKEIPNWNNAEGRTKEEVVYKMRETARGLRRTPEWERQAATREKAPA